jgi:hypothetical protein
MNKEFTGEKKVCNCHEDLLHLIETEDVFNILSEENMVSFNELMKYELIAVKDDKVYLTPLGKEAQVQGVKNVIAKKNLQKVSLGIPAVNTRKSVKIYLFWSLLFLFLVLLFLVFQYIWQ